VSEGEESYAVDGKTLRGSKRSGKEALRVVTLAGQHLRRVIAQREVEGGDELAAALRLLDAEDLEGKVVSADAGLLKAPLTGSPFLRQGRREGACVDRWGPFCLGPHG